MSFFAKYPVSNSLPVLANNTFLQGKDSGGVAHNLIGMSGNNLQVGDATIQQTIVTGGAGNESSLFLFSGEIDIYTGNSGNGTAAVFASNMSLQDDTGLTGPTLEIFNLGGGNSTKIKASDSLAVDYTLTLPVDAGIVGDGLITNGSGVLSWLPNSKAGWVKVTKTFTDFSIAANTKQLNIVALPAGSGMDQFYYNINPVFNGGTTSAVTFDLGLISNPTGLIGGQDVFTAPIQSVSPTAGISSTWIAFGASPDGIVITLNSTGDTLDHLTQGSIDFYYKLTNLNI